MTNEELCRVSGVSDAFLLLMDTWWVGQSFTCFMLLLALMLRCEHKCTEWCHLWSSRNVANVCSCVIIMGHGVMMPSVTWPGYGPTHIHPNTFYTGQNKLDSCKMLGKLWAMAALVVDLRPTWNGTVVPMVPWKGYPLYWWERPGSTKLGGSGDGIAASDLICRWSHCCRAGHGGSW